MTATVEPGTSYGQLLEPVLDQLRALPPLGVGQGGSSTTVTRAESPSVEIAAGPIVVGSRTCVHARDHHELGVGRRGGGQEGCGDSGSTSSQSAWMLEPGRVVLGNQLPTLEGLAGDGGLAELQPVEQRLAADAEGGHQVGAHRQQDADERHGLRMAGHRGPVAGEDAVGHGLVEGHLSVWGQGVALISHGASVHPGPWRRLSARVRG